MRKKRILTEEHKRKIGAASLGKKKIFSEQALENIRNAAAKRRGIPTGPCSEETKEKIRTANKGKPKIFENGHPSWFKKGCRFNRPKKIVEKIIKNRLKDWDKYSRYDRWGGAHRRWSREVRKRDNYVCQHCKSAEKKLHAHHIKSWKDHEMLRFDISNGIALCVPCHMIVHKDDDFRKLLSTHNKGKLVTAETRKKMSDARKGSIPWNKGIKGQIAWNKGLKMNKKLNLTGK